VANGTTPNGHGSANGSGPGGPAQNGSRP
jgi:hypothetical protein